MKFNEKQFPVLKRIRTKDKSLFDLTRFESQNSTEDREEITEYYLDMVLNERIYYFSPKMIEAVDNPKWGLDDLAKSRKYSLNEKGSILVKAGIFLYEFKTDNNITSFTGTWIHNDSPNDITSHFTGAYKPDGLIDIQNLKLRQIYDYYTGVKETIDMSKHKDLAMDESIMLINIVLILVLFKKYAPIETVVVNKKTNRKAKLNGEKHLNDNLFDITVVDSNWFTNIIRTEGFGVRGHFALRACGKGRIERKLVWISPFKKNGYHREAKKLKE